MIQGSTSTSRRCDEARSSRTSSATHTRSLSDYQRWSHSIAHPMVQAGEDIRWVPRRLVSSVALPGNDFYLFDDRLVVFLMYAGSGLAVDKVTSTDPADIRLCRSAFEAVWKLSISHSDYKPL